jgi:hypothetical protein
MAMTGQQYTLDDFTPDIYCAEIVEIVEKKVVLFLTGAQSLLSTCDSMKITRHNPVKSYSKYGKGKAIPVSVHGGP